MHCEGEFHLWFHLRFSDVALLKTTKQNHPLELALQSVNMKKKQVP